MRSLIQKSVIVLFTTIMVGQASAQTGKDFWFGAPDISVGHTDRPIYLRLTALDSNAVITVEQPANPLFPIMSITLLANTSQSIDLTPYIDQVENTVYNTVLNKGIHISSSHDITAYYEVQGRKTQNGVNKIYNADIFSLKGDNANGTYFMIPSQTYWDNAWPNYNPDPYHGFIVVAKENNTLVTITPKQAIVGHAANVPFTITMNAGQTYVARATSPSAAMHLHGSIVTSTKDITITLYDDSGGNGEYGGCKDLMGDQLIPVDRLGTEYIVVNGFLDGGQGNKRDKVFIMAVEDGTTLAINGGGAPGTLNKGDVYVHDFNGNQASIYINTNNPVYVWHISGFGCEVGGAIIPAIVCTGSKEVTFTRPDNDAFFFIVFIRDGYQGNFLVNGANNVLVAGDFTPVPGTGGTWVAARKDVSNFLPVGQAILVENNTSKFHLGIIHGGTTTGCMYGYFSDFGMAETEPIWHY
jgi:hypothetical protein